jgi:hypothetical protein
MNGKRFVKLVTLARGNTMKLNDRLVYSWLVRRQTKDRGASKRNIAKATCLHPNTVRHSMVRLQAANLVELREGRWHARQGEEFCYREGAEAWHERIRYAKVLLPSPECPLTLPQVVLYSLLRNGLAKRIHGLARLIGVAPNTIRAGLRKLQTLALIDEHGKPLEATEEQQRWFQDTPSPTHNRNSAGWADLRESICQRFPGIVRKLGDYWIDYGMPECLWSRELDQLARQCEKADYPYAKGLDLIITAIATLSKVRPVGKLLVELNPLLQKAEKRTQDNRKRGKCRHASSYGLFAMLVNEFVAILRKKTAG